MNMYKFLQKKSAYLEFLRLTHKIGRLSESLEAFTSPGPLLRLCKIKLLDCEDSIGCHLPVSSLDPTLTPCTSLI